MGNTNQSNRKDRNRKGGFVLIKTGERGRRFQIFSNLGRLYVKNN